MEQGIHYFRFKEEKIFHSFILSFINRKDSVVVILESRILKIFFVNIWAVPN